MSLIRRMLLVLAAAPLLYLPLRAAETESPSATPPDAELPAAPAEEEESEPAEVEPARPPAPEPDPGERLSLDNNISFPVDI